MKEVSKNEWEKLEDCGRYVASATCGRCNTKHFLGFRRCRSRFCLACNRIRTLKYFAKILSVSSIEENNYYHVVFTLRNMENLDLMIDVINNSWRRFYHDNKEFRNWFKNRFKGGIRTLEIKRGVTGWHVHLHALFISGKEYQRDFEKLRDRWKEVTNGEGSVWIKKAKNYKVVVEVVKYITDIEKVQSNYLFDIYWAIKRRRVINTFGILRGIDKKVEEELEEDIEEDIKFICRRCGFNEYELEVMLYDDKLDMLDL